MIDSSNEQMKALNGLEEKLLQEKEEINLRAYLIKKQNQQEKDTQ
jgi:hypothetical protein